VFGLGTTSAVLKGT